MAHGQLQTRTTIPSPSSHARSGKSTSVTSSSSSIDANCVDIYKPRKHSRSPSRDSGSNARLSDHASSRPFSRILAIVTAAAPDPFFAVGNCFFVFATCGTEARKWTSRTWTGEYVLDNEPVR
mmetsp:Transcript_6075/g.11186  ORF Transcript_6075/g.11186 Transcript_6075/m.11186 type:complete len:123 (+) Transcript_6075:398-766(+)